MNTVAEEHRNTLS